MTFDNSTRVRIDEACHSVSVPADFGELAISRRWVHFTRSGRLVFVNPQALHSAYSLYRLNQKKTAHTAERR